MEHDRDKPPDLGDGRIDEALAIAFAPTTPRPVTESVIREIESRCGIGAARPGPRPSEGQYRVLGEIGRGGIGVVFEARDRDLDRDVAVKVLRSDRAGGRGVFSRFVEEAQVCGQLEHPGIIPVYDLGVVEKGLPFIAMKLVRGRTLSDILAGRKSPDENQPRHLSLFEQVCQTVAYAHTRGVIHRDLKPANVIVGDFGEVQVLDWGLSKVLGRESKEREHDPVVTVRSGGEAGESVTGTVLGTPEYMSPEQARGAPVDERTDVFALGGVLLEILTGSPTYTGEGIAPLRSAAEGRLEEVRRRLADTAADRDLTELCLRCLSPDRDDRPRSAERVASEVAAILADREETARRAELSAAEERIRREESQAREALERQTGLWERRARRRRLAVAALLLVAILSAAGVYLRETGRAQARAETAALAVVGITEKALRLEGEGRIEDAEAMARLGLDRARAGDAEEPTVRTATELCRRLAAAAEERRERARRDAEDAALLAAVEAVRWTGGAAARPSPAAIDDGCREAFRRHGIDLDGATAAEIASKIAARRRLPEVVSELEAWAAARRKRCGPADPVWRKLLEVASLADPDPWRRRLRDAVASDDPGALGGIAAAAMPEDLPPRTVALLGRLLLDAEQDGAALGVLQRGRELHPGDQGIAETLGLALVEEREWTGVGHVMAATAMWPDWDSWMNLGTALFRARRFEDSLEAFRRAEEMRPDDAATRVSIGGVLCEMGDFGASVEYCRSAIAAWPDLATAHDNLGSALAGMGKLDDAVAAHRRAVEIEPGLANAWHNLGVTLVEKGDLEGAVEALERAVEADPESAESWYNLGNIQVYRLGRPDLAAQSLEKAVHLQPDRPLFLLHLAFALRRAGNLDRALRIGLRAVEAAPGSADAWLQLANTRLARSELADALEALAKAQKLVPGNLRVKIQRAWILADGADPTVRDAPEALRLAEEAARAAPRNPLALFVLGMASYRAGRFESAVEALESALELTDGELAQGWLFLAMAQSRTGRGGEARASLVRGEKLLEEDPEEAGDPEVRRLRAEAVDVLGGEGGD